MRAVTEGNTPFHLNLHHDDVGHTAVYGPTGAGKSVLLMTVSLQALRYPGARVFIIDKDRSSRITTLCVGGVFHDVATPPTDGNAIARQPLAYIDRPGELAWATEWLFDLFRKAGVALTPERRNHVAGKLAGLAASPPGERTLTLLMAILGDDALKEALRPFTVEGDFGYLLDGDHDDLRLGRWQAFELGQLVDMPTVSIPVMTYLFHRIEQTLGDEGNPPTLLIIDEGWRFLDDTTFAAKISEWLFTMRKKNVSVVFTTQTLASVRDSKVGPAIWDNCLTRIYLPNAYATDPQTKAYYTGQGLNERQVGLIARAVRKRQYYYASSAGNRLFELGLGEAGLALVGSSSPEDHRLADALEAACDGTAFLPTFLREKGLDWAADIVDPARAAE
jgi:type IV secretory pathway VirB4 component